MPDLKTVAHPAAVDLDRRLVPHGAELVLVVAEQLQSEVVVPGVVVVPGHRVEAGVGEVLVSLLAQQPKEGHLDRAHRVVGDLKTSFEPNLKIRSGCSRCCCEVLPDMIEYSSNPESIGNKDQSQ